MSKARENLATVLRRARREIAIDRRIIVECCTVPDKRGRPDIKTLEGPALDDMRRKDRIIAAIDRVLGRSTTRRRHHAKT